jgi:putative ABC transport system permease protein
MGNLRMNAIGQDIRYACRQIHRNPGFMVVAIITLALAIGANTAIFSLFDQVLIRSLPVKEADRLVFLRFSGSDSGHVSSRSDPYSYFSYPMYRDVRDRNSVFSGVIATDWTQVGLQWNNEPELVDAELVSGNYFAVLGIHPALGRLFITSDDSKAGEASPVAVLSFNYWRRRFGAEPNILNQTVLVNGHPFTVVGVAQRGFHSVVLGDTPELFVPMVTKPLAMPGENDLEDRRSRWLNIIARLKPGLNREQAQAGINPLWYSLRADELNQIGHSSDHFRQGFLIKSHLSLLDGGRGFSPLRSDFKLPLLISMAMVALVLVMACVNVGSLLMVRAAGRVREMSVRCALGATPGRIVQQLLVEGLLLGLAGGTVGILLAPRITAALINMTWGSTMGELPLSSELDLRILVFNFSFALLVSLLFSFAPALQFRRINLTSMKQRVVAPRRTSLHFRRICVELQIGLSLLLLASAGLFVHTLHNLKSLDVGFITDHVVTFTIDPRLAGYVPDQDLAVDTRVLQTLTALPGVRSVASTTDPELVKNNWTRDITITGYTQKENRNMDVEWSNVSPGYFGAMGMPLLAGREINDQDHMGGQRIAVVNEKFARYYFGNPQSAVGQFFSEGGGNVKTGIEIVGVVEDAKHTGVREGILRTVFTSFLQEPDPGAMTYYIRAWQAPESDEATIRRAMQQLDSRLVLDGFSTMRQQIDDNLVLERVIALLASGFGILAALMAVIGVYGVVAYSTRQRTREIGIRMALGATRGNVLRLILVELSRLASIGIGIAVPLAILSGRVVHDRLFGISSTDPLTLCLATLLVAAVTFLAALFPALRAAQIQPMSALRHE